MKKTKFLVNIDCAIGNATSTGELDRFEHRRWSFMLYSPKDQANLIHRVKCHLQEGYAVTLS